ncbi:hypothetical protein CRG98_034289, partial [Punica granatum]
VLTKLQCLDLWGSKVSDNGVAALQMFPKLSYLNLAWTRLKYLDLSSTGLGDESVEHIARIGMNLRNLNLSNTRVSSAGVEALAGCVPNLENLSLSYTQIDDFAVLYISTMPALKAIDLSHTSIKGFIPKVGDESDQALSLTALESHHLEKLNLENTLVEDDSLFPLSKLQQLRQLSLRNCSLTDISLHRLSPLTELKSLCFCDVVLTNHGLDSFKPPATLEMLDIRGCWLLTEDAISSFHEKYPQVVVRHELVPVLPQENQRLKYNREELLALRYSSLSLAPNNGDNVPKIQLD